MIYEIEGWQVLVLIDIHSKWIEAVPLGVAKTVSALQSSFSNFGLPKEIVTDNGPQFADRTSQIFATLMELSTHMHSPHPIIHWDCRMVVQVVKQAMKKMVLMPVLREGNSRFLLVYRSTPHATTGLRPDELFLCRRTRTCFSFMSPNLTPTVKKHQERTEVAHDGKQSRLEGEKVLVCNNSGKIKWESGIIIRQKSPVTY